ncbi:cell envelope biogenesis protein TolA [Candidatus Pelagibacter sp.]|nr:cell envelope biogenesis protein TolA [Candidatus Pelagibacter sp.]
MNRSIIISSALHGILIFITTMSLPFLAKKPLDIPPIVSVELIQIAEKTNIPFAPKAKKIIEKVKEKEKKLVSEQAPPKKVKKNKTKTVVSVDQNEKIDNETPEAIPLPDKTLKKVETKEEKKQNPDKLDEEVKQVSEFEKKELFDPNNIASLIDKSKVEAAETTKKNDEITQDQDRNIANTSLTLSEEDALKAQIFGCWSVPLGLPLSDDMLVRIMLDLKPDGSIDKMEMLDHVKMNTPGKEKFRTLADSVRRAVQLCNPLRVPSTGYERWKKMILNFNAREMIGG